MAIKRIMLTIITMTALTAAVPAAAKKMTSSKTSGYNSVEFLEDINAAKRLAKISDLPVMVLITGTGWCKYCDELKEDILSKDVFKEAIRGKMVLLKLDYRRGRVVPQDYDQLKNSLEVNSFPYIVMLDSDMKEELGRIRGYTKIDPLGFAEKLLRMLK